MGRQLVYRLIVGCGIVLLFSSTAVAQKLVGPPVDPAVHGLDTARERTESTRFRYATIAPNALVRTRLRLDLFDDVSVDLIQRQRGRQLGSNTWTGQVDGDPLSAVVLAQDDSGVLFGKIEYGGRTFLIRPKAGRVHAILEMSGHPTEDEGFDDGVPLPDADLGAALKKSAAASACLPSSTCSSKTIDVMVVYTSYARTALGGTHQAAQTAIAAAVAEMNTANANSGVAHTFHLVYTDEVWYVESGNASLDLSRLSGNFDGYMDDIHAWRDTYGADLVSLITDTGGCGIGYIQSDPTLLSSAASFNVVRDDCLTTNRSLAHEIGHNMGLHHDWYVNSNTTPCLWHHGYVNQEAFGGTSGQRWRTIMAYNNQCSTEGGFNCSRLPYWSNPLVERNGDPMGTPQGASNPADAAFALNRTACQVANFRASVSTPDPPMNPTGLVATGMSESTIDVQWNDNADDETGYTVQRSPDGISGWDNIATLAANSESYSDAGLPGGSAFYYRTFAFHETDQSAYSNVDSAATMVTFNDQLAQAETLRYGISAGDFEKTYDDDGVVEVIQEEETAGWLNNRTTRLDVIWRFDVSIGDQLTLFVNGWTTVSADQDRMMLSYSTDGVTFLPMLELDKTSDSGQYQSFEMGQASGSSIWVRLEDTDRGRGNRSIDQVSIDHLYLRGQSAGDAEPPTMAAETLHLGDLTADSEGKNRWKSIVTAVVHRVSKHTVESNATVTGVWNDGETTSCVTDGSGACRMERSWKRKESSATFEVESITKPGVAYSFEDNDVSSRVTVASPGSLTKMTSATEAPDRLALRQNYPNPFNPTTVLEYGLPEAGYVRLSVYNAIGVEVSRPADGLKPAGWHRLVLDGADLSSGMYFAILQTPAGTVSRTMSLVR